MKLFEPGKIGKMTVKNRVVLAAMGNMLTDLDGRLSEREIEYYVARARGGTGLIITSASRTRNIEQLPFTPLIDQLVTDTKIVGTRFNQLAEAVHDYGGRVCVQFQPGQGRNIRLEILKTAGAVAPSPVPAFADKNIIARQLSAGEIAKIANTFQLSAEVVRASGADAIEINAHGGYLLDEFMTALWNKRTDEYGGDLDGRLRFLMDVIAAIRRGAGADFPLIVKYGLTHHYPGGRTLEEGLEIARKLEAAGVDALDIDAGCYETMYYVLPPTTQPPGCMLDLAAEVKKVVRIPVIAVGRLHYPQLAEQALKDGKADFIAIGKGLLAEPEWANKVKQGRLEDLRPCLGDHEGCIGRIFDGRYISCTVNPQCGMEKDLELTPAVQKKSVMVIGGGPGGMEAAIVAAKRGHQVTLFEKSYRLGGNLLPASVPAFKHDYKSLVDYLTTQVKKLGVEVRLVSEVTPGIVAEMKPDVIFVATGSTPVMPPIPGIDRENVATAVDVLNGNAAAGSRIVIIGGGLVGAEAALHFAREGKKVTIVEILDTIACDMVAVNRMHLLKLLADLEVRMMTGAQVTRINAGSVAVIDKERKKETIPADTVVIACGFKSNGELADLLADKAPEVYPIGDCVEPRNVYRAIREGFRFARVI